MNNPALERIKQLRGMDEFKSLAKRLQRVAENKRNLPTSRIQLPNYLFIEAPGCGVTTHIRMITELLHELRLTPFEGDRKYFEWVLDANAFEKNGAFERLLDEITVMAGFHSNFKGVIGLEIEAWQNRSDSNSFTRLLDLAADCLGQIVFIFTVQMQKKGDPSELIRRMSAEMPLEVIHCPLPSADDMALYLSDFLLRRRFRVALATVEEFKALMPKLISVKAFDGFQTLDNLADEIVYHYCASSDRNTDMLILPDDIQFILKSGGYLDRLTNKESMRKHKTIGFQSGGEW